MVAAICFDLFETLITEYRADYQPSPSIAEQLQIEPAQFVRVWRSLVPARFRGELADFPATLREICRQVGRNASEELIAQINHERIQQKAYPFAQVDHRVMAMLTALRQRGLKLGLVSNASSEEVAAWQGSDLAPLFDATIFSFQVGSVKPEAKIYALACEALGVAPNATLFIGDGGSDELVGAQQVGLTPYWSTWFLDQWPFDKQSPQQKQRNEQFGRLVTPFGVLEIVDLMGTRSRSGMNKGK